MGYGEGEIRYDERGADRVWMAQRAQTVLLAVVAVGVDSINKHGNKRGGRQTLLKHEPRQICFQTKHGWKNRSVYQ